MNNTTLRNLFLFLLMSQSFCELYLNQTNELISELRTYFFSQCVILQILQMDNLENSSVKHRIVQVQKLQSRQSVMSVIVGDIRGVKETQSCSGRRSLYVLLVPRGDNPSHLLHELFSRLDPAGAVWLLLLDSPNASIEDLFQSLYIPFDCEFLVAVESHHQGAVELTEVYRVHQTLPLVTSHWGSWSYRDGLRPPRFRLVPRRNDLQGITFYAAALHDPPVQWLKEYGDGKLEATGFTADLMRDLSVKLNFSIKVLKGEQNKYGNKKGNSSWDGAIGMMLDGRVNMSFIIFTMNAARNQAVGFTAPVSKTRVAVYVRTNYVSGSSWEAYVSPFSAMLWLCVLVLIAVITCCLTALHSWRNGDVVCTFKEMLLHSWGIFCNQGFSVSSNSWSMLLVTWVSFVTAVVITAAYSARIIAFLAARRPVMPFNTLEGLLNADSYNFGIVQSTASLQYFKESEDIKGQIYQRKVAPYVTELPMDNTEGFQKTCNENYAFLCNDILVDYKVIDCEISMFPISTSSNPMGFILPRKSPYVRIINYTLRQMMVSGIVRRLQELSRSPEKGNETLLPSAELKDALAPIILCLGGCLLGLIVLLVEILVRYKRNTLSSKVRPLHRFPRDYVIKKTPTY